MKILRLIPYFSGAFGGPVHAVKRLTAKLTRHGCDTVVYTTNLADKSGQVRTFQDEVCPVRAFPIRWAVGDFFYTPGMKVALAEEHFDLIHAHCYRNYQSELASWLSELTGKPLVFTAHGTLPKLPNLRDRLLKGLYDAVRRGKVLRRAARVVALSLGEVHEYVSQGVAQERIVRIYHGVDTDRFRPIENGSSLRRGFGIGEGPIITYAGRLHSRKGLHYLILAFQKISGEFPDAQLVLCGPDYGYGHKLERLLDDTALRDKVVLMGFVPHAIMPQVYGASDVVVLPAQYEVFGHVIAEAAACGKAIVATKWGWASEFFEDGEEALLVGRHGDVKSVVEAISILIRNPVLREEIGRRARKKVVENLSWEKCAKAHVDLYRDLLGESA